MSIATAERTTKTQSVAIERAGVYVANVSPGSVSHHFARSMVAMVRADAVNNWNVWRGTIWGHSGPNVSASRNDCVKRFLDEHPDGEWLLFLDSDMVFPEDIILRLLAAAKRANTRIIGGLCVMIGNLGPIPTLYQYDDVPGSDGFTRIQFDYPVDALLQVAATGAACLMIHRDALTAMRQAAGHDHGWFSEHVVRTAGGTAHWVSEDIAFCAKANQLGYSVFVDCTLQVGHHKHGRIWHPEDVKQGVGLPRSPIVAAVPVKDRLDLTQALVGQLRDQGDCDEIVVMDNGSGQDTADWLAAQDDITVLPCPDVGIHVMWNRAAEHALAKHGARVHVAFLNNDLKLGPAVLRHLSQALDADRDFMVVGGNYDRRRADVPVVPTTDICAMRYDGTGGLGGFAFMVRGEWLSGGYRFPEDCAWWYGDNDLLATLAHADRHSKVGRFRAGIVVAAEVEHLDGGGKTAGDWFSPEWADQLTKDREAFEAKWTRIQAAEAAQRAAGTDVDLTPAYQQLRERPSDINEHLETLHDLAVKLGAQQVIELGVCSGQSTTAWLTALHKTGGRLWSVDVDPAPADLAAHPRMTFIHGGDLDAGVLDRLPGQADIVFVDTSHTYEQTKAEIQTYRGRVRPGGCMVFHDVAVPWFPAHQGSQPPQPPFPVRKAVEEWIAAEALDEIVWYEHNHGLAVVWL